MPNLLTPFEVVKYSAAGKSYPLDNIRLLIPVFERDFMISCIGEPYYNSMLKDVRKFDTAKLWVKGTSYNASDYVIYNGSILESCKSLNTSEPSITNEDWRIPNKFSKKAFNSLWDNYLRNVLCFKIYKEALPQDTILSGAKGLVVTTADQSGAMTAQAKDIEYILRHIQKHIDLLIDGMKNFIQINNDLYKLDPTKGFDYSEIYFVKEDCEPCNIQGKQNRTIAFLQ